MRITVVHGLDVGDTTKVAAEKVRFMRVCATGVSAIYCPKFIFQS